MERLSQFFSDRFMAPHGFCFMWLPEILWLHVIADTLIALSYFSIPLALWWFAKKRPDMPFHRLFILFATFITLCGLTHLFGIFVLWKPFYGIEGLLMLATGLVSSATAVLVWKILPSAITLPSPSQLAEMNRRLSLSYEEIERKVSERTAELEAMNAELIAARLKADQASEAKTEFLANMSHEIRTPINVVIGLAEILGADPSLNEKQDKYVSTLKTSADSLLSLIDDLLDIAKIESNQYEPEKIAFNPAKIVSETAAVMEIRARTKHLAFELKIEDGAMKDDQYIGDPKRFRQMLLNLCSNAVKFTEKGAVTVTLDREAGKGDIETIIVTVADTGIGIAADKQERIFEKFVQADNSITRRYGGTGLGLAITKTFAEGMGGTIMLASKPGEGSAFTLRIPMMRAPSTPVIKPLVSERQEPQPGKGRVLLVEDYEPNAMVASIFLEQGGYEPDVATDGISAIEKYKSGNYVLVLMDIQMPGKDGWQVTDEIRRYESQNGLRRVPIIGMTAHAYAEDYERCLRAGMDDYISKPYKSEELRSKINDLLG